MNTFTEWCAHYDYDPSSEAAKADYAKYQEQLNFFQQLDEPCFLEDEGPSDDLPQPPHRTVMYHIANDRGYWLPKGYGYTCTVLNDTHPEIKIHTNSYYKI